MGRERIDYRKIAIDLAIGIALAAACFGLVALAAWPFGRAMLGAKLAIGFCGYVPAVVGALLAASLVHRVFRMESDPPRDPYVLTNIGFSAFVQAGWAAFVAIAVRTHIPDLSLPGAAVLLFLGLVASWVATLTTASLFQGSVYRTINALVSAIGYAAFAAWPAAGLAVHGWLFAIL